MLVELDSLTFVHDSGFGNSLRGRPTVIKKGEADLLWDTMRGVVWVNPRHFQQKVRVFSVALCSEMVLTDGVGALTAVLEKQQKMADAVEGKRRPKKAEAAE